MTDGEGSVLSCELALSPHPEPTATTVAKQQMVRVHRTAGVCRSAEARATREALAGVLLARGMTYAVPVALGTLAIAGWRTIGAGAAERSETVDGELAPAPANG